MTAASPDAPPPLRHLRADGDHMVRGPEPFVSTVRITQGPHTGTRGYFHDWLPDGRAQVHISWDIGLIAVPADWIEVVDA
jgi:hypothetical protein